MTTLLHNALEVQGNGAQATTPKASAPLNKSQDLREAAQQLRDAIQNNVREEVMQAKAEAAAAKALQKQGFSVVRTPPVPQAPTGVGPFDGGPVTIRTPDGGTTVIQRGLPPEQGIPPQAVDISIAFFVTVAAIMILLPVARAFARRMDRRSAAQVPPEVSAQLNQLNQAVDAIALEVERISENQRFTTRLLTEQRETATPLTTGANR